MFRVIREVHPAWVVGENVANLTNFMEFENALLDMESEGYEVQAFIIPAVSVGAWHKRDRVWIVAKNPDYIRCDSSIGKGKAGNRGFWEFSSGNLQRIYRTENVPDTQKTECKQSGDTWAGRNGFTDTYTDIPDTNSVRKLQQKGNIKDKRKRISNNNKDVPNSHNQRGCGWKTNRENAKNGRELQGSKKHGRWDIEPNVGRVANGIPNRVDRLKSLGNAIVPQIAYEIFKVIDIINKKQDRGL